MKIISLVIQLDPERCSWSQGGTLRGGHCSTLRSIRDARDGYERSGGDRLGIPC